MNYELAKQLKDAGFPRDIKNGFLFPYASDDTREKLYFPTLSELVEACGKEFGHLNLSDAPLPWLTFDRTEVIYRAGATMEEAVANLWLALNNK